jgi:3-hydroxyacyl-CoA dehydrogenase
MPGKPLDCGVRHYLRLLELIPTPETEGEVVSFMSVFCDRVLGKGVVIAKDTPNFIANRIGIFTLLDSIKVMLEQGCTVEEVDALTGRVIGRPMSATFRTLDILGLDTAAQVANNLYVNAGADEKRETFRVPEFLHQMVERRILGDKTRGGFFQRTDGKLLTLEVRTLEYRSYRKARFPWLDASKNLKNIKERLQALVYAPDRAGDYLWRTLSETLCYAVNRLPEIADNIVEVDNAMKWGFGHELGVFETWDVLGLEKSVSRMRKERRPYPCQSRADAFRWVSKLLQMGNGGAALLRLY